MAEASNSSSPPPVPIPRITRVNSAPTAWSTRFVIIQKDEKGFGLRVSGDNPVYVESVRQDGAAWRAGVRAGDRIIKVNGALVTKDGHQEVVRKIQGEGSPYVSLHLLGKPPPLPPDHDDSSTTDHSSTDNPLVQTVNTVSSSSGLRSSASMTTSSHNRVTSFVDNLLYKQKSTPSLQNASQSLDLSSPVTPVVQLPEISSESSSEEETTGSSTLSSPTSSRPNSPTNEAYHSATDLDPSTTELSQLPTIGGTPTVTSEPNDLPAISANGSPIPDQPSRADIKEEMIRKKRKQKCQRRQLLNEILKTEKGHVRNLQVLDVLFYTPCKQENLLSADELNILFANHTQLLALHTRIYEKLKACIRPVLKRGSSLSGGQQAIADALGGIAITGNVDGGDSNTGNEKAVDSSQQTQLPTHKQMCAELVALFEGELGIELCRESAAFCCRQAQANELLKQKRNNNFLTFLSEAERSKHMKRLGLKDLLAACFQRLTKYPLMLDSLLNTFDPQTRADERRLLERAVKKSKDILGQVNALVKREEGRTRLAHLQRRAVQNLHALHAVQRKTVERLCALDWAKSLELIHEGPLTLRMVKQKNIDIYAVLTSEYFIMFTKEGSASGSNTAGVPGVSDAMANEKEPLVLKVHHNTVNKSIVAPVLPVRGLFTRDVATDRTAFFVVFPDVQVAGMYEFVAATPAERKIWTESIGKTRAQLGAIDTRDRGLTDINVDRRESLNRPIPEITRPRSIRVMGRISTVTQEEEAANRLLDYRDHVVIQPGANISESTRVLSPFERLKRLEREIRERVEQRRVLMRRNRDETELEHEETTNNGEADTHGSDDLLSLVCALELSTLTNDSNDNPADENARENLRNRIRAKLLAALK